MMISSGPDTEPASIVISVRGQANVVEVFRDELPDDPNGRARARALSLARSLGARSRALSACSRARSCRYRARRRGRPAARGARAARDVVPVRGRVRRQRRQEHFRTILLSVVDAFDVYEMQEFYKKDPRPFKKGRLRILNLLAADRASALALAPRRGARDAPGAGARARARAPTIARPASGSARRRAGARAKPRISLSSTRRCPSDVPPPNGCRPLWRLPQGDRVVRAVQIDRAPPTVRVARGVLGRRARRRQGAEGRGRVRQRAADETRLRARSSSMSAAPPLRGAARPPRDSLLTRALSGGPTRWRSSGPRDPRVHAATGCARARAVRRAARPGARQGRLRSTAAAAAGRPRARVAGDGPSVAIPSARGRARRSLSRRDAKLWPRDLASSARANDRRPDAMTAQRRLANHCSCASQPLGAVARAHAGGDDADGAAAGGARAARARRRDGRARRARARRRVRRRRRTRPRSARAVRVRVLRGRRRAARAGVRHAPRRRARARARRAAGTCLAGARARAGGGVRRARARGRRERVRARAAAGST